MAENVNRMAASLLEGAEGIGASVGCLDNATQSRLNAKMLFWLLCSPYKASQMHREVVGTPFGSILAPLGSIQCTLLFIR